MWQRCRPRRGGWGSAIVEKRIATTPLLQSIRKSGQDVNGAPLGKAEIVRLFQVIGTSLADDRDVTLLLKQLARWAGIDPARISGHSPRIGRAQDLAAGGVDLAAVIREGPVRYPLRGPLHRHLIIAVPHKIPDSLLPAAVQ